MVAEGTPEQVAGVPASHTGKFLRDILGPDAVSDAAVPAPRKRAPVKRTPTSTAAPRKRAAKA